MAMDGTCFLDFRPKNEFKVFDLGLCFSGGRSNGWPAGDRAIDHQDF